MANDNDKPKVDPARTTHLDTGWDDEPTYTDKIAVDEPGSEVEEGPPLPKPRSVAPPRVIGSASVPPPPGAQPAVPRPPPVPRSVGGPVMAAPPAPLARPPSAAPGPPKAVQGIATAPARPVAEPSGAPPQPAQLPTQQLPSQQPPLQQPPPQPPLQQPSLQTVQQPPLPLLPQEQSSMPVSLGEHLNRRVLLGGFAVPSWVLSAVSVFATAVLATIIGVVVIIAMPRNERVTSPAASTAAPAAAESSSAALPVTQLAATGDTGAMSTLESKPAKERSIDETFALASGRSAQRKAEIAALAKDLERNPKLGEDPDVLDRLFKATEDDELAREALRILATLPGPSSVDVIYEVWVGTKKRTETTRLAEELVFLPDVRKKASPALAIALDLRDAQTCEQVKLIVDRAIEHGDRRSLRLLGNLTMRQGCGPGKGQDCWACLRGEDKLTDAVKAVLGRAGPKF